VRRVCSNCIERYTPDEIDLVGAKVSRDTTLRDLKLTEITLADAKARATPAAQPFMSKISLDTRIGDLPFFRGKGCDQCQGSGLKGRQGLYELMYMTPKLRRLIMGSAAASEIRDAAIAEGMLTLRMDGWLKILKGLTTLDQMVRETAA
jgi:type IV pilus assembly protein PilB